MPTKTSLRNLILARTKTIPALQRRVRSKKILGQLLKDPSFSKAEHVAIYFGISPEVMTQPFLKVLMKDRKVYLPKIQRGQKLITFLQIRSLSKDLMKGPYGIMEPRASCRERSAAHMDLIVVPGVAFDRQGGRLGRGAGYYDRLLKRAKKVVKIGLCFREQLVKKVPMKAHDVRMDRVIRD